MAEVLNRRSPRIAGIAIVLACMADAGCSLDPAAPLELERVRYVGIVTAVAEGGPSILVADFARLYYGQQPFAGKIWFAMRPGTVWTLRSDGSMKLTDPREIVQGYLVAVWSSGRFLLTADPTASGMADRVVILSAAWHTHTPRARVGW